MCYSSSGWCSLEPQAEMSDPLTGQRESPVESSLAWHRTSCGTNPPFLNSQATINSCDCILTEAIPFVSADIMLLWRPWSSWRRSTSLGRIKVLEGTLQRWLWKVYSLVLDNLELRQKKPCSIIHFFVIDQTITSANKCLKYIYIGVLSVW